MFNSIAVLGDPKAMYDTTSAQLLTPAHAQKPYARARQNVYANPKRRAIEMLCRPLSYDFSRPSC